jgi:hypothetical protein
MSELARGPKWGRESGGEAARVFEGPVWGHVVEEEEG